MDQAKQIMFQSSVGEVVRKMRSTKKSDTEFLQEMIAETKSELSSKVQHVKVTAVQKLTYFSMLGYNGEYGAFNVIEIMADQNNFGNKRTGYVAASCTFTENTAVLPLCTAQLKKDLSSPNQFEVCLALYCLSCIATPDLARDLVSDVVNLLSHQRPIVRKKAILCLYKIFLQFPDALRPTFPKLKAKIEDNNELTDSDPSVRGAVVNIFCELARRNPQNFLNLVPPFYNLVTSLHNNWTLIKVIKLLGHFVPLEPRLGKKLVEPFTNLITTSAAKSVQYECLYAVAAGMRGVPALLKLAIDKLKPFAESRDPNLRYLGLDAMTHIVGDNAKSLSDLRTCLVDSLTHNDFGIRSKALTLYSNLATKKNLVETVNKMFEVISTVLDDDWSNTVIKCIIDTISRNDYELVQDFDWYIAVLMDLAQTQLSSFAHGALIENEFVVILTRVPETRPFGVENLASLLSNAVLLGCAQAATTATSKSGAAFNTFGSGSKSSSSSSSGGAQATDASVSQWSILKAAAFLCGEFPQWLPDKLKTMKDLMNEKITHAPSELQATCVTAAMKLFLFAQSPQARHLEAILDAEEEEIPFPQMPEDRTEMKEEMRKLLLTAKTTEKNGTVVMPKTGLYVFARSVHTDVQERALLAEFTIRNLELHLSGATALTQVEIDAIVPEAQSHVELPADLDLSRPFADDLPALIGMKSGAGVDDDDDETSSSDDETSSSDDDDDKKKKGGAGGRSAARTAVDQARRAQEAIDTEKRRRQDQKAFYLSGDEAAGGADGKFDDDGSGAASTEGSPTSANAGGAGGARFAAIQRKAGTGAGGIRRPVAKPSTYKGDERVGSQSPELDEATLKLRDVKVTGQLTKDDVLPTIQPYARVDPTALTAQSAAPSASAESVAAVETRRIVASTNYTPIELFAAANDDVEDSGAAGDEAPPIQVEIQFVESKLKKDGTVVVSAIATVQNKSDKHSVYNVAFKVGEQGPVGDDGSSATLAPQITDANGVSVASLTLCDKAKSGTKISAEFSLLVDGMASIAPIPLAVTYKLQKVDRTAACLVPFPVKLFMSLPSDDIAAGKHAITSETFNSSILPTRLASAGCLSAAIPVASSPPLNLASCVAAIAKKVGLNVIDVFKQSATFCGQTLHRKSSGNESYIALLLHVAPAAAAGSDEQEVTLVVKAHSTVIGEALLTEAAEVVASALSQ